MVSTFEQNYILDIVKTITNTQKSGPITHYFPHPPKYSTSIHFHKNLNKALDSIHTHIIIDSNTVDRYQPSPKYAIRVIQRECNTS
jgi:hypothetical protein